MFRGAALCKISMAHVRGCNECVCDYDGIATVIYIYIEIILHDHCFRQCIKTIVWQSEDNSISSAEECGQGKDMYVYPQLSSGAMARRRYPYMHTPHWGRARSVYGLASLLDTTEDRY
jgi:hypothetical protein